MEFEKIITKFITAIQDLNSKNNLEKKIILKKSLFNLKRQTHIVTILMKNILIMKLIKICKAYFY